MELVKGRPTNLIGRSDKEIKVYDLLEELGIEYERMDHEETNTMEECHEIDLLLNADICKNLFLCNRQKTQFYLLMMPGNKPFKTKDLSSQINSARLSFADAEYMEEYLHIKPGAVSIMGLMNDTDNQVQLLIDRQVTEGDTIGCHPCVSTASIKISIKDILEKFLPAVHHEAMIVELPEANRL